MLGDSYKFEDTLCEAFNYFYDVTAEKHAVAGTTDIECIYSSLDAGDRKFDVEAKSTKNKLTELSGGRLKLHRDKIGSEYTIVITTSFTPVVLHDIKDSRAILLKSASFSNFLYQSISKKGRIVSYKPIDDIVVNNFGKDITGEINQYVYENFGINAKATGG